MKAMILAAGRGERMRPLTDTTPKPLLRVGGKPLLEYHLQHLASAGVTEAVINIAYLGDQIRDYFGHCFTSAEGQQIFIQYSEEPEPLETAGAILHALPLLGDAPFLLMNGDVWTDYPIQSLLQQSLPDDCLGHLVLVSNPPHHSEGDFAIDRGRLVEKNHGDSFTFSGVSVLSPALIRDYPECRRIFPLGEVFRYTLKTRQLSAEYYQGEWWDIGTVDRLQALDRRLLQPSLNFIRSP